jgi:F420-dependent oxidoreductase-like protein
MRLSVEFPETTSVARATALARTAESHGFDSFFLGAAFGFDPIMVLGACGATTSRISLGTAVVPTWPRHPIVMAQQALTAQAMCAGRFRLGLGASHTPVMALYGIDFDRPVSHLREYVHIVRALLHDGNVKFRGERYQVQGFLGIEDVPGPPPVLLAALQPQLARLGGELSDGVIPWLAPVTYLRDVIVPAVAAGADRAARIAPPVIASVPVVLADTAEAALDLVRHELAIYPHMPFYRKLFESAGVELADDAMWTSAMLDAAVVWGDLGQITERLGSYFAAGADEVICSPFARDGERLDELLAHLGARAKET